MYEAAITPPLGTSMPGQAHERKSSGVKDDLYAKAAIITTESCAAAWIVIDALFVPWNIAQAIRERVCRSTGIPVPHVMVSATHTHTGPPVRPGFDGSTHDSYSQYLTERAADAATIAYERRQPAQIGWRCGKEDGISFNRRYWMKDGRIATNPGINNPEIDRPAGPIDPDVQVVRIDDMKGAPLGVIVNFACHTCTVPGTEYHPDYPGELSREVKKALGEHVVCLFTLGACGDINHLDTTGRRQSGNEHYREMGRMLASQVLNVREQTNCLHQIDLDVRQRLIQLQLRVPTAQELAMVKLTAESETASQKDRFRAVQLLEGLAESSRQIEMQAFRIGGWVSVCFPGELYAQLGLELKRKSPFDMTTVVTLSNGSIYGYVCTLEAFRQGGYGTALSPSRIPVGAGEILVDEALSLLAMMESRAIALDISFQIMTTEGPL